MEEEDVMVGKCSICKKDREIAVLVWNDKKKRYEYICSDHINGENT